MTTAHRATWKAAHGGAGEEGSFSLHAPSTAVAARDVAGQTALKVRSRGPARSSIELRRELDERERALKRARTVAAAMLPLRAPADHASAILSSNAAFQSLDADVDLGVGSDDEGEGVKQKGHVSGGRNCSQLEKEQRELDVAGSVTRYLKGDSRGTTTMVDETTAAYYEGSGLGSRNIDDLPVKHFDEGIDEDKDIEDDEDVEDDDDDDDDDEEELRAELMRIRAEREEERVAAEVEQAAAGNPLLKLSKYAASSVDETDSESIRSVAPAEFRVRRRWDDDVVFKNQAKNERPLEPRFINDTIRNDFHRRFMKRYVR
jgi:Cwf15/Cwc15 cell cycle control protein